MIFFLSIYHDLIDSSTPKLLFSKLMKAVNERQAIYYKLSKKCLAFRKVISVFHFGSISKKMCQITILSTFPLRRKGCRWVKKRDFGSEKKYSSLLKIIQLCFYLFVKFQSKLDRNQESPLKKLFKPVMNEPIDFFKTPWGGPGFCLIS